MKRQSKQDLSSAYGDQDDTLSWPGLLLVILYTLTIGWVRVLAHSVWLWATSPRRSPPVSKRGQPLVNSVSVVPRR